MFVRLLTLINFCSYDNTKGTQMILDFFPDLFQAIQVKNIFAFLTPSFMHFYPFILDRVEKTAVLSVLIIPYQTTNQSRM